MKCKECKYIAIYPSNGTRNIVLCEHPNQEYIDTFCVQNGIGSMPGFVCYTKPFEKEVTVKTSPRWCPFKKKNCEE